MRFENRGNANAKANAIRRNGAFSAFASLDKRPVEVLPRKWSREGNEAVRSSNWRAEMLMQLAQRRAEREAAFDSVEASFDAQALQAAHETLHFARG